MLVYIQLLNMYIYKYRHYIGMVDHAASLPSHDGQVGGQDNGGVPPLHVVGAGVQLRVLHPPARFTSPADIQQFSV